ncbi:Site-specific recombinase XerD [Novosphingobium sp. CF614]|uniref:tyrosine-type recombinase/integrase n=1 Tax=Novosphingobium sp. CF614 TaxID=1884364 RepID=UPI0008E9EA58|nr:site-specific integrase [Novosphingobium sp. CF614]SFG52994.1 Site-specific recombinase XerD [Novosphingobium sp. CF614]
MSSKPIGLTDAKIKGLKAPVVGQVEIKDAVVPGLRLRMGASGAQTFLLRKRVGGAVRNITIGRYSERFGLAEARKKARIVLSDIEAGGDPYEHAPRPIRGAAAGTVRGMWPDYRAAKADRRSITEIERVFNRHLLPQFGDRLPETISRAEITRFIDSIAAKTPVMARMVLGQFSSFYGWAMPRLDRLQANPCRDAGRPPPPKARDRVLTLEEVGVLWNILAEEGPPFGPAIKLLLLTGQRRNEVFNADRAEFDIDSGVWTIPTTRAKNGVAHLVPLAREVLEILESIDANGENPKLFSARGSSESGPSGFSKTMVRIRKAFEEQFGEKVQHWTLHDLRRTVATGLQRLGVRLEVTEAVLNHISGSRAGIVGVYQRHNYFEEKKVALEAWATEVARLGECHRLKPNSQPVRIRRSSEQMRALGMARGRGDRQTATSASGRSFSSSATSIGTSGAT